MAKDASQILVLGASSITLGGTDMGFTTQAGAVLKVTKKDTDGKVADYGDNPVVVFTEISAAEVDVTFAQMDYVKLQKILTMCNFVTNASLTKAQFGRYAGQRLTPVAMVITPVDPTLATLVPTTLYAVVPKDWPTFDYVSNKTQDFKMTFRALPDPTRTDGNWIGTIGDTTITTDAVAPTITAVAPTNGASAQATSAVLVYTFSKNLDASTVNAGTFGMFKASAGSTPTTLGIPVTVVLVNAGASTTVTVTPKSALPAGSTIQCFVLTTVKDTSGNRLGGGAVDGAPGYVNEFATA